MELLSKKELRLHEWNKLKIIESPKDKHPFAYLWGERSRYFRVDEYENIVSFMAREGSSTRFEDDHIIPKAKGKNKDKMEIDGKNNRQIIQWASNKVKGKKTGEELELEIKLGRLNIGITVEQFLFLEGKDQVWTTGQNWKVFLCGYDFESVENLGQMVCAPDERTGETDDFIKAIKEYDDDKTKFLKGSGSKGDVPRKRCGIILELYKYVPDSFNTWRTLIKLFKEKKMKSYLTTEELIKYAHSFTAPHRLAIMNEYGYIDKPSSA